MCWVFKELVHPYYNKNISSQLSSVISVCTDSYGYTCTDLEISIPDTNTWDKRNFIKDKALFYISPTGINPKISPNPEMFKCLNAFFQMFKSENM